MGLLLVLLFEGKVGEDPGAHATTFHLWCSSNSLNEDSVRLRLFQRTLTSTPAKWYIELRSIVFGTCLVHSLATFSFRFNMISEWTCYLPLGRTRLPTSRITSKSGGGERALLSHYSS